MGADFRIFYLGENDYTSILIDSKEGFFQEIYSGIIFIAC
jgi:hypothetical protein